MCKDQGALGPEPIRAKDHGLGTEPRGEAGEGGDARASGRVEEPGGVTGLLGATAAAAGAGLAGGRGLPARGWGVCGWLFQFHIITQNRGPGLQVGRGKVTSWGVAPRREEERGVNSTLSSSKARGRQRSPRPGRR